MRISDWSSDVCSSDLHRQRGDVARVEIGSESYEIDGKYNGKPAAGFAIRLASGANALDTVEALHAQVEQIGKTLPSDVKIAFAYDSTPFVRVSIEHEIGRAHV